MSYHRKRTNLFSVEVEVAREKDDRRQSIVIRSAGDGLSGRTTRLLTSSRIFFFICNSNTKCQLPIRLPLSDVLHFEILYIDVTYPIMTRPSNAQNTIWSYDSYHMAKTGADKRFSFL